MKEIKTQEKTENALVDKALVVKENVNLLRAKKGIQKGNIIYHENSIGICTSENSYITVKEDFVNSRIVEEKIYPELIEYKVAYLSNNQAFYNKNLYNSVKSDYENGNSKIYDNSVEYLSGKLSEIKGKNLVTRDLEKLKDILKKEFQVNKWYNTYTIVSSQGIKEKIGKLKQEKEKMLLELENKITSDKIVGKNGIDLKQLSDYSHEEFYNSVLKRSNQNLGKIVSDNKENEQDLLNENDISVNNVNYDEIENKFKQITAKTVLDIFDDNFEELNVTENEKEEILKDKKLKELLKELEEINELNEKIELSKIERKELERKLIPREQEEEEEAEEIIEEIYENLQEIKAQIIKGTIDEAGDFDDVKVEIEEIKEVIHDEDFNGKGKVIAYINEVLNGKSRGQIKEQGEKEEKGKGKKGQREEIDKTLDEILERISKLKELQNSLYAGWGFEPGELSNLNSKFIHLLKLYESDKKLKKIIDKIGRTKEKEEKRMQKVEETLTENKMILNERGKEYVHGITLGDDIMRVLPTELGYLSSVDTEDIFYLKYVEKKLLCYELAGNETEEKERKVEKETEEKEKKEEKGAIVAMLDTSGSMSFALRKSRAILLQAFKIAKKDKRDMKVLLFGSYGQIKEYTVDTNYNVNKFINFISQGFNGGTDFETPFNRAIDIVTQQSKYTFADIFMITDGECSISENLKMKIKNAQKKMNLKVYTVIFGENSFSSYGSRNLVDNITSYSNETIYV